MDETTEWFVTFFLFASAAEDDPFTFGNQSF